MPATCVHRALLTDDSAVEGQCPLCLLTLGLHHDVLDDDGDGGTAVHPRLLEHDVRAAEPLAFTLTPGTVVAQRFRITSLLGRGGMGEVYRADDLKLGQPVALKFLPSRQFAHPEAAQFVYDEVRIGRQIAHPNVCRVYDVFEIDGRPFIEMELVEGEDLASLIGRIGRLPYWKALEIARDVCSGLEAAHQKKIVHGDLKPANILIDGHGRARITDFGLSRLAGDSSGRPYFGGTVAYMAPEQLLHNEVSARSDIYALGLVLYEIFTGRRARRVHTLEEAKASVHALPQPPSNIEPLIDSAVEDSILHCLAPDPAQRPASARAISDAFPAGEALSSMIAAGETPPAEIVAASRAATDLRIPTAWALLAASILSLALLVVISDRLTLYGRVPLPKDPAVLAERAREMYGRVASGGVPLDEGYWFEAAADANDGVNPSIEFHWRGSPGPMLPRSAKGRLTADDPPLTVPGMAHVVLTPAGELLHRKSVAADGSVITFPTNVASDSSSETNLSSRFAYITYFLLLVATLAAGGWLARRNLRAGRVDRKAAMRVAVWVFSCRMFYGLLVAHHPLSIEQEFALLQMVIALSVMLALQVWVAYAALEPVVRRTSPHSIITWTRFVQGRFRDPIVGRDLIIGVLAGIAIRFADQLRNYLPTVIPSLSAVPSQLAVGALAGVKIAIGHVFLSQGSAVFYAFFALFLLVLLRRFFRRAWLPPLLWLVLTTAAWNRWDDPRLDIPIIALQMVIVLALLVRAGLLAATVAISTHVLTVYVPLTFDVSAFYFSQSAVALTALASIAIYGFYTALGGRPAFGRVLLDPVA